MLTTILLGIVTLCLIMLFVNWDAKRFLKGKPKCPNCGGLLVRQDYGWYGEHSRMVCPTCITPQK